MNKIYKYVRIVEWLIMQMKLAKVTQDFISATNFSPKELRNIIIRNVQLI